VRPSAFAVLRLNTDLREKVPTWAQSRFYQIGAGDRSVTVAGGGAQAKESVLRIGPRRIRHIHAVLIEPRDIDRK
jgi:hypothetical protein